MISVARQALTAAMIDVEAIHDGLDLYLRGSVGRDLSVENADHLLQRVERADHLISEAFKNLQDAYDALTGRPETYTVARRAPRRNQPQERSIE